MSPTPELAGTPREKTVARNYPLMTAILVWCGLVVVSSLYITIPMVSVLASAFDVLPSQAAWTGSAFSFAYAVGFLFFGPLSERYGRKQMMLLGLISLAVISPLLGLSNHLTPLIWLRAIQGVAAASFAPAVLAYVVEMFPAAKRVTAIGFISTGFLMAGIAGQVFSSFVSQNLGWSSVFYFLGGIYFLSALLLGGLLPKGESAQQTINILTPFKKMGTVFLQRPLFLCYLVTVTLLLSFVGMYTALGSYLSGAPFELNGNRIMLVRTAGIAGMLLSPFAGRLVAGFGMLRVLHGGLALAVSGLALLGVSSSLPVVIMLSVLFVAGISITVPTLISLIGTLGGEARGIAVTLYTFILFLGATLGPIVTLHLLKTGSYTFTFEGLAIVLGLGFTVSLFVRMETGDAKGS